MGRALRLNMMNIWVLGWLGVVPGIAPPATHPPPHPGYTPSGLAVHAVRCTGCPGGLNKVVGLISVEQLTLDARISEN